MSYRADSLERSTAIAGSSIRSEYRWLILFFMLIILLPVQPSIGSVTLQTYKLGLLIFTIPLIVKVATSDNRLTVPDVLILIFGIWCGMTLLIHHGNSRIPFAIITTIEFIGAYFAGRALMSTRASFRFALKAYLVIIIILMPIAFVENRSGVSIISDMFSRFVPVNPRAIEERLGGFRAQSVFAHPIHYGLFSVSLFACLLYSFSTFRNRLIVTLLVLASAFFAQSSAPLLALALQFGIISWSYISKDRWKTLVIISCSILIFLTIASDRGPVILLIEHLTLNPRTAWWRVHIWNFGIENVVNNPLWGIGLNEWERPVWLASTVDNFWLVVAMRHGIPAFLLLACALSIHIYLIIRQQNLSASMQSLRAGYLISIFGLMFTMSTVHLWGQIQIFVFYFLGAGSVFYLKENLENKPTDQLSDIIKSDLTTPKYTRFRGMDQVYRRNDVTYNGPERS